jgi:hypothetical protein
LPGVNRHAVRKQLHPHSSAALIRKPAVRDRDAPLPSWPIATSDMRIRGAPAPLAKGQ